jgi:hypothetical protein
MPRIRRRSIISNHGALHVPAPGGGAATWERMTAVSGTYSSDTSCTVNVDFTAMPPSATRFVVLGITTQHASPITNVTVNGHALAQDVQEGVGITRSSHLWSGLVPTGTGSLAVVITSSGTDNFTEVVVYPWAGDNLEYTAGAVTDFAQSGASSNTIDTKAGALLVAILTFSGTNSGSTETPTATINQSSGGAFSNTALEWKTVLASNAAFSISLNASNRFVGASYGKST